MVIPQYKNTPVFKPIISSSAAAPLIIISPPHSLFVYTAGSVMVTLCLLHSQSHFLKTDYLNKYVSRTRQTVTD